jgi:1-acyl-sn-glycerol-3-phosphate acyltransferase
VIRLFAYSYWVFVAVTMPLFFVVALVILVVTWPFDRRRVAVHLYSCLWASIYIYANPIWRVRFEGRERIPWKSAAVIVCNHLSLVDILVLYGLYRPFKWVAKAELFRVPVVGWNMVINDYVRINRGATDSVRAMLRSCRRHLGAGSSLMIFPEGTRSSDGRLQAFKEGAFRLAMDAKVPVVPVALSGTYETLPKQGILFRSRMNAWVKVLEPLDPARFESAKALRDAAREAIARALGEQVTPDAPASGRGEPG